MIVLVAGSADWTKVQRTLDYFHRSLKFTRVVTESTLARRWAMERGVDSEVLPFARAISMRGLERVVVFEGAQVVADMARARGVKVIEVC